MIGNFRGNFFQDSGSNRIEIITWEDKKNNSKRAIPLRSKGIAKFIH
jgi:hypothetical protein